MDPEDIENKQEEVNEMEEDNFDDAGDYDDDVEDFDDAGGDYDDMGDYDDSQFIVEGPKRTMSLANSQYNMPDLLKKIYEDVKQVQRCTTFSFDWAMIYFAFCGWKIDKCIELIDEKGTHIKVIHYNPKLNSIQVKGKDECLLCCQQSNVIIKGLCGDQFCEECWKNHISERLKNYYTQPFPPCLNDCCEIKVSPKLCQYLGERDANFKKLFVNTLCRSYATYNYAVKICKGRPGVDCNRCFSIEKLLNVIECDTCKNLVCPRCGQQAHGTCECYALTNWKKITEDSLEFVEFLNIKICPNCKQGVQRKQGCNSMVCKCKHQFCYICGQTWLPNHKAHGDQSCYRFKEMMALEQQRKKKRQKGEDFFNKVQNAKSVLSTFATRKKLVFALREKLPTYNEMIINNYGLYRKDVSWIEELCSECLKSLAYLKGWRIQMYFDPSILEQAQFNNLKNTTEQISGFLIDFYAKTCEILEKKEEDRIIVDNKFLQKVSQNFAAQLREYKEKMEIYVLQVKNMIEKKTY